MDWTEQEEEQIVAIMATETMHDSECRGCKSCDDSKRESCHQLCNRAEAIRRMRRRTVDGIYIVRDADRRIYARELKRWSKTFLAARANELAAYGTPQKPFKNEGFLGHEGRPAI
jgi:hypothetical protein